VTGELRSDEKLRGGEVEVLDRDHWAKLYDGAALSTTVPCPLDHNNKFVDLLSSVNRLVTLLEVDRTGQRDTPHRRQCSFKAATSGLLRQLAIVIAFDRQ